MKQIRLLVDENAKFSTIGNLDGELISLSSQKSRDHGSLVDGELTYRLFELTQEADELAMTWSRAAVKTLSSSIHWQKLLHYEGVDLRPLLVNRLFRGFFIDGARVFLSVKRLIRAEEAKRVLVYDAGSTLSRFAELACILENVTSKVIYIASMQESRKLIPGSLRTFIFDIAYPTLKNISRQSSNSEKSKKASNVVFIKRGELAIEMVMGALHQLAANQQLAISVVSFDFPHQVIDNISYRRKGWHDYYTLRRLVRLARYQSRVMMERTYLDNWAEVHLEFLSKPLLGFIKRVALPSITHTLGIVDEIISEEDPGLLICVDETGLLGKSIAAQGKRRLIPTLNVQHGVRSDSPWIEDQLFDRFAVFGPATREVFSTRGNHPDMFVCTGVPRYDDLFRRRGLKSRLKVAAELGLDPNRPIVVFASQRSWGHMTPTVKSQTLMALVLAWQETDSQLVVKLRSGQDDYLPAEILEVPGWESALVTTNYDLYDLLHASDLVVTAWSTVGMEAVALGKPLLIINLTGQPDHIPYVTQRIAMGVYQPEDVKPALKQLLTSEVPIPEYAENRKKFIRQHLTRDDGRSAERLADLMLSMISYSNRTT